MPRRAAVRDRERTMVESDRRQFLRMTAAAASAGSLALPSRADAASRDAVIEAAKGEGGLVWYDHYDRAAADGILADFKRAYPFVKYAEFVDVPSAQKTAKVVQESMAGGPTTDVLLHGAAVAQSLYERGLLLEADWAALGVAASPVTTPTAYMIVATTAPYVLLYNIDQVKAADVPKDWDDAVDPKWQARTGHWMRATFFIDMLPTLGEDGARDLVNRLAALRPRLFDGQFPLAQAVGSGEIAQAITAYDSAVRIVEKGAPVKFAVLDPTPLPLITGSAMKYGKSPNTARLFLAWLATPEGAIAFEKWTMRGNYFVAGTATSNVFKDHRLSFFTAEQSIAQAKKLNALETEFSRKLAGRKWAALGQIRMVGLRKKLSFGLNRTVSGVWSRHRSRQQQAEIP
jgi:iron(III) transport system substrate-binding protein